MSTSRSARWIALSALACAAPGLAQNCTELTLPAAVNGQDQFPAIGSAISPSGRYLVIESALPNAPLELSSGFDPQRNFQVVDLDTGQVRALTNNIDTNTRPLGWSSENEFAFWTISGAFNGASGISFGEIRLRGTGLLCNLDARQTLPECPATTFRRSNPNLFYTVSVSGMAPNGWVYLSEQGIDPGLYPRPLNTPSPPIAARRGPLLENLRTGEVGPDRTTLSNEIRAAAGITGAVDILEVFPGSTGRTMFLRSRQFLTGPQKGLLIQTAPGNLLGVGDLRYHFNRDTGAILPVTQLKLDTPPATLTGYNGGTDSFPFFQYGADTNRTSLYLRAPVEAFPNHNPDGSPEIYLWDRGTVRTVMPNLPRFIRNGVEDNNDPTRASISANGRFINFTSRRDLVGRNPDGSNEVYRVDVDSGQLLQVSNEGGGDEIAAVAQRFGLTGNFVSTGGGGSAFSTGISADGAVLSVYFQNARALRSSGNSFEVKRYSAVTKVYRCPI